MRTISVTILFFLIIAHPLNAQVSQGGLPFSMRNSYPFGDIPTYTLPELNIDSLLQADAGNDTLPPRFAYPFHTDLNLTNSGITEYPDEGGQIWRLRVSSLNAFSIGFIFDEFYLPPGSELYLYNEDRTVIRGAFTALNNKNSRVFSIFPFPGNSCILELYIPDNAGDVEFRISVVTHDYRNRFGYDRDYGDSADCNVNVNCPGYEDWEKEKRSVCLLLTDENTRLLSGALINNAGNHPGQDYQYLLTAYHGIGRYISELSEYMVLFNYESQNCGGDIFEPDYSNTASGLSLVSAGSEFPGYTDFAILKILEPIPEEYEVYYSGWNAGTDYLSEGPFVGIHHPKGDIKKISSYDSGEQHLNSSNPNDPNYCCTQYSSNNGSVHYQTWTDHSLFVIPEWDTGIIENGSSGSPLFNSNHQIIGQLRNFYDSSVNGEITPPVTCENNLGAVYGWMGMSFDWVDPLYFPQLPTMRDVLDPDDLGVMEASGRDWWQIFGCTDPYAANYDPNANTDDGSCECGLLGDVNNDGFVDVLDLVILTDFVLGTQTPTECQKWAGDVNGDGYLTINDQTDLVYFILNGEWPMGRYMTSRQGNAIITAINDQSLIRGDGEHLTLILDTNEPVRAIHFELDISDTNMDEITISDDISFMTLASDVSSGNIEIIVYGQEGQSIPEGRHEICYIYFDDNLDRNYDQRDLFFRGVYVNDQKELLQLNFGQNNESLLPAQFEILSTYPNPFNAGIMMEIGIPLDGDIIVSIFDINGRKINSLSNEPYTAGIHKLRWEADDYPSGVYFIRAEYNKTVLTRKIILLK